MRLFNSRLWGRVAMLQEQVGTLSKSNADLWLENAKLTARITDLENPKAARRRVAEKAEQEKADG